MVTSKIFQNVSNNLWQLPFSGKPWPHPDNHRCSKNSILSSIQICNSENAKHMMYEKKLEKYLLNVWNCINVVSHVFMTVSPHYSKFSIPRGNLREKKKLDICRLDLHLLHKTQCHSWNSSASLIQCFFKAIFI